jgi:tetratricopeptide (TPR) repeat protein
MTWGRATTILVLLTISSIGTLAQGTTVQGRVYLPNGQPIERAIRVELRAPRATSQLADSDTNGRFSFRAVGPGEYTVYVDAGEEFEPATQSLLVDSFLAGALRNTALGKSTLISIYLRPRARASTPAEVIDAKLASVPKKALEHYSNASKLAESREFEEAAAEFRKAIEVHPGFYQAYFELGKIYMKLGRYEEAASSFRSVLELEPTHFGAHVHLGIALLNQKKLDEALPVFVRAVELTPSEAIPFYYLGVIKNETGDVDEAIKAFEKSLELNGTKPYPMLHKYLASLYLKKSQWAQAVAEMEKYLEQSPDAADAEQIRKLLGEARARIK